MQRKGTLGKFHVNKNHFMTFFQKSCDHIHDSLKGNIKCICADFCTFNNEYWQCLWNPRKTKTNPTSHYPYAIYMIIAITDFPDLIFKGYR